MKGGLASPRCSTPRRRHTRAFTALPLSPSTARVDASAEIGPYVVIEAGAEIGPGCRIGPFVSIGQGVTIGADCRIGAHASLSHALLGARVYVYPGARIGQEGFSFATTKTGFLSIPQLGRVIVEDDVEVGANTTIDRGSTHDTVIGAGSRLDNLVQIGHNVRLGRCCVIVAQVGIAGSTVLEDFVQVGGQARDGGTRPRWPGCADRRTGRCHFRCARRCGTAGQPSAAANGILPPGGCTEAYCPKAEITCSVRKSADLSLSAIHAMLEHDKQFPVA